MSNEADDFADTVKRLDRAFGAGAPPLDLDRIEMHIRHSSGGYIHSRERNTARDLIAEVRRLRALLAEVSR